MANERGPTVAVQAFHDLEEERGHDRSLASGGLRVSGKALVAALVITGLGVAGLSAPPVGAAVQAGGVSDSGEASAGRGSAAAGEQSTNATSTSGANGSLTMWCTTSNSSLSPGLLDLLATQYHSGPVQTVTCIPAAVVAENATGGPPRGVVTGSSDDSSGTARSNMAAGGFRGNVVDPSAAAQGLAGFVTEQSALAATGPAGPGFDVRGLSALLIGLGVLGVRIARAATMRPSTSQD